ncbi:ribonuclease H-like domain-containing protein [Tanacetum coccineum]
MSLHGYSDGEYDAGGNDDNITLISKLDASHPLHLHPNDFVALTVVSVKLKGTENYQVWSCAMLLALEGKNKTGFIDGSCRRAKHVWDELKETYDKLNALWKQFDALIELPRCTCHAAGDFKKHNQLMKLMQFLMGLDDTYMQIRSSILSRETLPDVRSAYVIISSEESHRIATGYVSGTSQRPNDNRNRRTTEGSTLICKNYGFNGHTIDRCFKIIGYPASFGKRKAGSNFKGKNVSNNVVGSNSSNGFSDEQMATLISLIKENFVNGKGIHANMPGTYMNSSTMFNKNIEKFFCSNSSMHSKLVSKGLITDSGANQRITYTDKNLTNVIDVSYLKIKVTQPNGIEAFITKIGNMMLTNYLTLYDVLIVSEYYVSLMSVHKVDRDSKLVIAFDEMHCYVMNQDLREGKILGTGKQIDGLYYFDGNQGELVHLDLWGPYKDTSTDGFRFFLAMNDFLRAVWVYLLKSKTKVFYNIMVFYNFIKTQFKKNIKVFRSDNGTEFVNQQFNGFWIPLNMWTECILTATYLINRLPTSVLNEKSPYDLVYNMPPSLKHLRSFGCLAYATVLNSHDKFSSRSEKCVLGGCLNFKNGYKLWSLDNKQIVYSRNVKFFEDIFPFKKNDSTRIDKSVQDVNHLNFFNTNTLDDLPEIPNDEERRNPSPIRHDASASENGSFVAYEEHNSNSKGNGLHDQSQDNVSQDNNGAQNLRRL